MTFWTIIWITYTAGPFADISTGLPYPSMAACSVGLVALQATVSEDVILSCVATEIPYSSPIPKPRPWSVEYD